MSDQRTRFALLDQLLVQIKQSGIANLFLVTVVGMGVWWALRSNQVIVWVLVGYLATAPRFIINGLIANVASEKKRYDRLEHLFIVILFLSGLHWGVAGWLFLDPDSPEIFAFVLAAILGVVCATLASFTIRPFLWFIYAASAFGITIAKLLTIGNWGIAAMGIGLMTFLTMVSRSLGERIKRSITQDFRNAELLEEVSIAKEAAEKANLEKSLFMAATSHDLRQPLHAQSLLLEVLSNRVQESELNDLVRKIVDSNDALNSLFNSLLEVSQLDAGTITVHKGDHSLTEICELIVDEFREVAGKKNLTIELTGDYSVVRSDAIMLTRIIRNLVSNAIKFTSDGGVKIHTQSNDSTVSISIFDTGIGIPASEQKHIFNEYTQLGNKARDRNMGIGLGLAIVRRLCELLEHSIEVESSQGKGSCFTLVIPRGDHESILSLDQETEVSSIGDIDVLLIDDEQPILDAMQTILTDWSCRSHAYISYQEAADSIDNTDFRPDLILSDYRLNEDVNGIEAIRLLRDKLGADIPAILISGDTDPELLEHIQKQDFYLLHKPLKSAKLRKVIGILLDR